jgi:multidrug efflux pump subunit AcrA (membrane-fusion protein)
MTTNDDNSNRVNTGVWEKIPNVIGFVLLVVISYQMGLGDARSEKSTGEYGALKAQYDRIEAQYSALKAQYDRTEAQYAALKAQYDRIEAQRSRTVINEPTK